MSHVRKLTTRVSKNPGITHISPPTSLVPTTNGIDRNPIASVASISSAIRIEPISAVMRHPACDAKATPATSGAISRTLPHPLMIEDSAPNPMRSNVANASIATIAPTVTPRIASTLIEPPSTMSDPRPQARLFITCSVSRR
ncbi:Uncharacterised protein [Mycobacteroides abscessus]|nr:Uncharacterised protein [Mycobacteroides abscessus]